MTGSLRLRRGRVILAVSPSFDPTGKHAIDAITLGPLAVTPSLDRSGWWRITHVGTGRKVDDGLYGHFRTRRRALLALRKLVAIDPVWRVDALSMCQWLALRNAAGRVFRRMAAIAPLEADWT